MGVTRFGASSYFAGLSMLESAGVKPSEVTFIQNGGVGESYAALLGGRVDVCMIGYPFGLRARKEGFHLLFRPSDTEYGLFPTAVIGARESWLKDGKNRRLAIDFLRALTEGQQLARENAAVTKKALGKFTRTENDAELQGSFDFYKDAFSSDPQDRREVHGECAEICRASQGKGGRRQAVFRQQFSRRGDEVASRFLKTDGHSLGN